jgi:hypothetical protein
MKWVFSYVPFVMRWYRNFIMARVRHLNAFHILIAQSRRLHLVRHCLFDIPHEQRPLAGLYETSEFFP